MKSRQSQFHSGLTDVEMIRRKILFFCHPVFVYKLRKYGKEDGAFFFAGFGHKGIEVFCGRIPVIFTAVSRKSRIFRYRILLGADRPPAIDLIAGCDQFPDQTAVMGCDFFQDVLEIRILQFCLPEYVCTDVDLTERKNNPGGRMQEVFFR